MRRHLVGLVSAVVVEVEAKRRRPVVGYRRWFGPSLVFKWPQMRSVTCFFMLIGYFVKDLKYGNVQLKHDMILRQHFE